MPRFSSGRIEVLTAGPDVPEVLRRTGEDVRGECSRNAVIEAFTTARLDLSVDDALPVARDWKPDLVVHDVMDFVGPLVAFACGARRVSHTFGADVSAAFVRAASRLGGRHLPGRSGVEGWRAPQGWLPLRPEAYRAPTASTARRPRPSTGDARVLVTFGTVYTDPEVLTPLVQDLAATGYEVRVALGLTASPDAFAVDSDAVVFEVFRPYDELLDGIDVVVGHGGAGTNLGALAAGLPLVLIPQGADQAGQARCVVAAGAAISIAPGVSSPSPIARVVADVLEQRHYRAAARKIAFQIAAMPSAEEVAALLAR
jgi:hypothetical protein